MSWPIVVITGANSGVGFGICQRLLCQLSVKTPPDTFIRPEGLPENNEQDEKEGDRFVLPCEGITLIMACRSVQRAEVARQKLLRILDQHVQRLKKSSSYDGHAERFQKNVRIVIHPVDLASLETIPKFVQELEHNYPYVSHLICNAGIAPFTEIYWPSCIYQLVTNPLAAMTTPRFYLQTWGEISQNGYGYVWQCNVFGHYTLYKDLTNLLSSSKYGHDSRVIWTSSLESKKSYDAEDWQLKETHDPYGSSKYQVELLSVELDRRALHEPNASKRLRHFTAHPGVTHTNIDLNLISPMLHYLKHFVFYLARWIGSPNHPISLDKGAVSVVWLSIISLSILSVVGMSANTSETNGHGPTRPALKFAAQTDWMGHSRVGVTEIEGGEEHSEEARELVNNCEDLYEANKAARI
ncbi:3-keto sterol reductase [Lentinula raphanica]|uniref:3-keto sterol reductase n=1 Tax=Lentinula raphanica TaxID=153919 RepID=A0AA38UIG7_9AGAR|nr:3-keto sterol reductase [Lentinula raphanica]KAJ3842609.1 3-keto sterol reductase [Lentinula raphanica]KAJ3977396.1 3-keto sterol reductase [Lentinula raphanica]